MADTDSSPEWFLHRLDAKASLGQYVSTTSENLRKPSFIDGRERFWTSEEVRLLSLGDDAGSTCAPPPCFIFHVSFCGSTLLGQLLDHPGRILVLREPQALVDLSTQQSDLDEVAPGMVKACSEFVISEWGSLRAPGEALVIKPSNWANPLVPILCNASFGARAVFLSMAPDDFVTAVFRGGRDRMAYAARAAAHLANATGLGAAAMQNIAAGNSDPLYQIACFAALSHRVQEHIFRTSMAKRGWGEDHWIDLAQIVADPPGVAKAVAKVLSLNQEAMAIERQAELFRNVHSKDPTMAYSLAQRTNEDTLIKLSHGSRIDRAVNWAASVEL